MLRATLGCCLLFLASAVFLACFLYLDYMQARGISVNLTTNEMFNFGRYAYLQSGNPYDRGFLRNWLDFCLPGVNERLARAGRVDGTITSIGYVDAQEDGDC